MNTQVFIRSRTVVNTDPERRCYNGCNFSERVDFGPWSLFGEYDNAETARLVMKGLRCDRYEYEARTAEMSAA